MDIGTAIRTLRKTKGYSQKGLAEMCDLSINALCQIEKGNSFPQKSTIKRICDELGIPTSYLLLFSISDEDIPEEKKDIFNILNDNLKNILMEEQKSILE